jgi:DNA recombination protein RmuC
MVVNMPGGGVIVVDSKVVLDAYLQAIAPDSDRAAMLAAHARQLREQVNGLAKKQYDKRFAKSPDLVVMFVPIESALSAAMEADPSLHADALESHVLIATPTLLIALLRAVAYGWQQESIAENARQIADVGQQLHERLEKFVEHFAKVGTRLQHAVESYNGATGALEHRVLVSARRLRALGATAGEELESADAIDVVVRNGATLEAPWDRM